MSLAHPVILVFDSGLGGLTVLREIQKARPDARYVYLADNAFFPYGDLPETVLIDRVVTLIGEMITRHRPDLVVIACHTASTLVLPALRAAFTTPFIGTVPAIKPAAEIQLATARELRPVMADHQQDRGAEEQHAEGAQREGQGARFRRGFRVAGEDALALFFFDQAFGIPSRRLVDQPIAETFGEGHGGTIVRAGVGGKGKGGG